MTGERPPNLKVGDYVWIRNGNDCGRSLLPIRPIKVMIIRFDFGNFQAHTDLDLVTDWWYGYHEIFEPKPRKKGNFVGERVIQ
jgi:hypothetical protein